MFGKGFIEDRAQVLIHLRESDNLITRRGRGDHANNKKGVCGINASRTLQTYT